MDSSSTILSKGYGHPQRFQAVGVERNTSVERVEPSLSQGSMLSHHPALQLWCPSILLSRGRLLELSSFPWVLLIRLAFFFLLTPTMTFVAANAARHPQRGQLQSRCRRVWWWITRSPFDDRQPLDLLLFFLFLLLFLTILVGSVFWLFLLRRILWRYLLLRLFCGPSWISRPLFKLFRPIR